MLAQKLMLQYDEAAVLNAANKSSIVEVGERPAYGVVFGPSVWNNVDSVARIDIIRPLYEMLPIVAPIFSEIPTA
jgi:hypothetical protein